MSKSRRVLLATAIAVGVVLGITLPAQARAEVARDVTGTWEFQLSFVNCQTGDVLAGPFRGLHSYHRGGTLSEQGFSVGPPPSADRTVGLGIWRRQNGKTFRSHFRFYSFDAASAPLRRVEVDETVEVDAGGATLTAVAVGRVFDLTGTLVATNCLAGTGERLSLP
ncbi:MAG: hypothetical protein R3325_09625 [Thermoanaerobaculia bacterium]|nr:hypothetical protein [Thermoanaerobaculia bacterium]